VNFPLLVREQLKKLHLKRFLRQYLINTALKMKKLLSAFSLLSLFLPVFGEVKANQYKYIEGKEVNNSFQIYGINSSGSATLLNTYTGSDNYITGDWEDGHIDEYEGKLYFDVNEWTDPGKSNFKTASYLVEYDFINNSFSKKENLPNDLLLYPRGVTQMIKEKSDGSIHIGENSAVFKEENGREKFWAQDANGKSIPIDITNASKLLINGRDVEQSINNVGALSAALTGLPTVPTDTTLACGLGTGTHGGDFAFSGGCASKVNDKLSINYAASMTMPGQDYAGDFEDTFSARAGFVWKLGKLLKPTQISMGEKEKMEEKILSLEENNKKIIFQNEDLKQKNQSIISQNKSLLARLERLEKIALSETQSKDLATIKLP